VTPVGTADIGPGGTNNVAPNLVEAYEGMTIVTNQQEVDIEKLAELEPDLILATNVTEEDVLAQVKEIAPVYQFTLRGGKRKDWQNRVTEVADALNRAAEFDEVKVAWEKEIEDAATQYADVTDGVVVGVISSFTENNVYAWGEENMTGTFLMPLGFTWSEQENASVEGEEEAEKDMSQELIGDVVGDADILFYDSDLHETPSAYTEALRDSSLYQELPAVQAGHDYPIGKVTIAGFSDARVGLGLVTKALDDFGKA
jgi:iron complex transport system substrate-binding protein